jgi:hypothetical protein
MELGLGLVCRLVDGAESSADDIERTAHADRNAALRTWVVIDSARWDAALRIRRPRNERWPQSGRDASPPPIGIPERYFGHSQRPGYPSSRQPLDG